MVHSVRPWLIAALVAFPAVSAPPSGFDVRAKEGLVTIDARAVPLSDVLDQLGHQTGMKLVYEAGRPRQLVSASLEGLPPPVALAKLLEGLGVGYSFSLDVTGTRVETLIISGVSAAATASLARPRSPAARPADIGGLPRVEAEADASPPPDEETPEPTGQPDAETAVAAPAAQVPGSVSGGPPPFSPLNPGPVTGGPPPFAPFTGPGMRELPTFPGSASAPMPFLPPPVIPTVASNPQPSP